MTRQALYLYLIDGMSVGQIARALGSDRATVRAVLKTCRIQFRPTKSGMLPGREPVCASTKRAGYSSFHDYAQVNALLPITEQATALAVTEKALNKVYSAYRGLLLTFKSAGIVLPTSQISEGSFESGAPGDCST